MRIKTRFAPALATAALLVVAMSGVASANSSLLTAGFTTTYTYGPSLTSKTIDTEAGSCAPGGGANCSAAAVYGANGFTGQLTFSGTGSVTVWDYICTHVPNDTYFKTKGGTYTLKIYDGASLLGSATYAVTGGLYCSGSTNHASGSNGVTFTVPSSHVVTYSISISGITAGASAQAAFSSFNAIRNEAFDNKCDVARSYSVPPPTNFIIPEAPFAILLPLSAGLLAAAFVVRRPHKVEAAA